MRIWPFSDVHLEMSVWDLLADRPEHDVVVVVSGDLVTRAERGVAWLRRRLPGSHASVNPTAGQNPCFDSRFTFTV